MLLYGPPGTGKTTTIINLVKRFQEKNNQLNKGLLIHLNASDERGIDTIRNQIHQFVNSQGLFTGGVKFVILDEVDYMTKSAQQALKYLLHGFTRNVRFCLICNYISRVDESLQNEFMRMRFNQLPEQTIIRFLAGINTAEQLNMSQDQLKAVQQLYLSDIRSMINYMQANRYLIHNQCIIDATVWQQMTRVIQTQASDSAVDYVEHIAREYGIEPLNLVKDYFNYFIQHQPDLVTPALMNAVEFVMHLPAPNVQHVLHYVARVLKAGGTTGHT